MAGMEECLNVDRNKPIDSDNEKNNSRVEWIPSRGRKAWDLEQRWSDYP